MNDEHETYLRESDDTHMTVSIPQERGFILGSVSKKDYLKIPLTVFNAFSFTSDGKYITELCYLGPKVKLHEAWAFSHWTKNAVGYFNRFCEKHLDQNLNFTGRELLFSEQQ